MMLKKQYLALAAVMTPALLIVGCATQPANKPVRQPNVQISKPVLAKPRPIIIEETTVIKPTPKPQPAPQASYRSFEDWKSDFSMRAIASGFNTYDVQRLLAGASLNSQAISSDNNQAEFVKMPWDYADSAVSDGRVSRGQGKFAEQRSLLNSLESRYGVDAGVIAAIWGMESSFGAVTGSSYLPSSLGSLAYDGRRRDFAESQLTSLLTLLNRGDVSWSQLDGSWAGGMGQTQFIPATWLEQGVDGDGDGHRNPWATADALASTANYLNSAGWVRGLKPFYEVRLPASFDYRAASSKRSFSDWRALGVNPIDGAYVDAGAMLELWLPAGKDGPALLTSRNFDAIKVYNNSSNYALGVSLLAKALKGESGLIQSWPRYERPLSTMQVTNLQQRLTSAGFDTKGADGVIGTNTRNAFARWQAANGQTPDGFITQRSAAQLIW